MCSIQYKVHTLHNVRLFALLATMMVVTCSVSLIKVYFGNTYPNYRVKVISIQGKGYFSTIPNEVFNETITKSKWKKHIELLTPLPLTKKKEELSKFDKTDEKIINFNLFPNESIELHVYAKKDDISGHMTRSKSYETEMFKYLNKILKKNSKCRTLGLDYFIDIGVMVGTHTLFALKHGKSVISVEANIRNVELLLKSIQRNDLLIKPHHNQQLKIVNGAVYNKENTIVKLPISQTHVAAASLDPNFTVNVALTITHVATLTLDSLLEILPVKGIILHNCPVMLKMDIEGVEHLTLQKSFKLFTTLNISHVIMEFHTHNQINTKQSGYDIIDFFKLNGYEAYSLNEKNLNLMKAHGSLPQISDILFMKII